MPPLSPTTTPAGEYFRGLRGDRNQTTFAGILGISQPTVSRIESGELEITPEIAWRIVTKLGRPTAEVQRHVTGPLRWAPEDCLLQAA